MNRITRLAACGGLMLSLMLPSMPVQAAAYDDVEPGHWAASYIETATQLHLLEGVGGGQFAPGHGVTYGQYAAMMTRLFCPEELPDWVTQPWWYPYTVACLTQGYLEGSTLGTTTWTQALADTPCSRQEMALIMVNALEQAGLAPSADQVEEVKHTIPDWDTIPQAYQPAVAAAYSLGILCGNQQGAFEGARPMTRAEAAKVLCVLYDLLHQQGTT